MTRIQKEGATELKIRFLFLLSLFPSNTTRQPRKDRTRKSYAGPMFFHLSFVSQFDDVGFTRFSYNPNCAHPMHRNHSALLGAEGIWTATPRQRKKKCDSQAYLPSAYAFDATADGGSKFTYD